jgi:hypothetical protein
MRGGSPFEIDVRLCASFAIVEGMVRSESDLPSTAEGWQWQRQVQVGPRPPTPYPSTPHPAFLPQRAFEGSEAPIPPTTSYLPPSPFLCPT